MNVGKHSHITPILYKLHCLPIQARIKFQMILFTFKAVHNLAPSYINSLLTIKSKSSYCLRSNDGLYLEPPKGGERRDTKTLNLSRNIVSLQVLVDVSRFSPCVINLTRNKNICCGLKKCRALIG